MADEKRQYRMRQRAEAQEATRQRITESAAELHGSVGPSRTSVSAVAERAGVRRSTVYRHFPDEAALFRACSAHWSALNPPPSPEAWMAVEDPDERLAAALGDLYPYYRRTERMLANLHRDEEAMPIVKEHFGAFWGYLGMSTEALMAGRRARGRTPERLRAAVGHALAFTTWRSLARGQGLSDAAAADLMCRLVHAAGRP